ncbi:MAG: hypothetical protein HUJ97_09395, partial [Bacteroidales bacterium]|nr:hypothetical protein [Bacteroidales bacterium]
LWFSKWINNANLKVNEDKTNKNIKTKGHYDFMVNNKRIEIKTAYRGKTNTWQHENIYKKDVCDTNIFIDVDIDCIYLSVVYRNEIPFEYNSFFGNRKKATLRSGKIDGYKLDFSKVQIKLLMEKGRTLKINPNTTSDKDISKFLEKLLN